MSQIVPHPQITPHCIPFEGYHSCCLEEIPWLLSKFPNNRSQFKEGSQEGFLLGKELPLQHLADSFFSGKMFFSFSLGSGGGRDGEDSTIEGKVGRFLALPFCPDVSILAGKAGADCLGLFCSALTRLSLILNYIRLLFLFFHISFQ